MPSTRTFLKNHFATVRSVITQPRKFYRDMPTSGSLKEPLNFAILTIIINSLLFVNLLLVASIPFIFLDSGVTYYIIFHLIPEFLFFVLIMPASISLIACFFHIILKTFDAKGSFEATLQVFSYSLSISYVVLIAVFIFIMIFILVGVTG
ncbi:MAG: YIP1 family protein, partial [ANME-2 cluster archaeon]|nr:YIP1 family protein [ANME-2 cluster archaeon]